MYANVNIVGGGCMWLMPTFNSLWLDCCFRCRGCSSVRWYNLYIYKNIGELLMYYNTI